MNFVALARDSQIRPHLDHPVAEPVPRLLALEGTASRLFGGIPRGPAVALPGGRAAAPGVKNAPRRRVSTAVVHLICNQGVGGSNPSPGTSLRWHPAHRMWAGGTEVGRIAQNPCGIGIGGFPWTWETVGSPAP